MTASQAAKRLEVSIQTVYRHIQSGQLRGFRRDGKWYVQLETSDVEPILPRVQPDEQRVEHLMREVQQLQAQVKQADCEGKHLTELVEEKTNQILYLHSLLAVKDEQLARRDDQMESLASALDHAQQLLALSQKSIHQLTEQNQLLLEDKGHRERKMSWFKRTFRWT